MDNRFELILGDSKEELKNIKDKSIDLIVIDPPYNIGKADWDVVEDYIKWLGAIYKELDRVLKDNGSFYFFQNDFLQLVEIQNFINEHTEFKFKQLIVWNKKFKGSKNEGFLQGYNEVEGLRNYQKMAEYCLFYTKQEDSGLNEIKHSTENFKGLRGYFKNVLGFIGESKASIMSEVGQRADHTFRFNSSQWELCTFDTYKALIKEYEIDKMEGFREWEDLKREYDTLRDKYESQRYTFNNQKTHHSVWNYDIAEKKGHITPKPVPLIENIIKHSSNEDDIVLDCFMGSGTTGVAARNLNRRFIGIEIDENYFELAKERIYNE